MSFPTHKQKTIDEKWRTLLELMSVPDYPNVYVLGCFARYVTIYSQQVRALNLVDALCNTGVLSRHSHVAVVGGGIAGLTAAAAVAVSGVSVTVFEKEKDLMYLQRNSQKRKIHPHNYDWPHRLSLNEDAGLPLLDWKADEAMKVVKHLDQRWKEVSEDPAVKSRITVRTSTLLQEENIHPRDNGKVGVTWEGQKDPIEFDALTLAVGFGIEETSGTNSYWKDEDLNDKKGKWLVSGFGDGALTDLMRLCIRNFYHGDVLDKYVSACPDSEKKVLADAESQYKEGDDLTGTYCGVAKKLGIKVDRSETKVVINCTSPQLFSPKSSTLNRLIVAHLLNEKAFDFMPPPRKLDPQTPTTTLLNKKVQVNYQGGGSELFDGAIVRHGPAFALEKGFPKIWKSLEQRRLDWKAVRQGEDWTREPLYDPNVFKLGAPPRPLRVDFAGKIGCVVVHQGGKRHGDDLSTLVGHALVRANKVRDFGRLVDPTPEVIFIGDALGSVQQYERTVRAICQSELAVFDVCNFNCAAMFLLGIRSAARRGVTVTVRDEEATSSQWLNMPFNLFELNPISLAKPDPEVIDALKESLTSGFKQMNELADSYLDLPAYEAVRQIGSEPEQYEPIPPEKGILLLCWFAPEYREACGNKILNNLDTTFGKGKAIRVIDTSSPQLVGQRLYATIRRTSVCFVDWTGWRPNVFFELGVRLAVNECDPVMLLCTDEALSGAPLSPEEQAKLKVEEKLTPSELKEREQRMEQLERFQKRIEWTAELKKLFDPVDYAAKDNAKIGALIKQVQESFANAAAPSGVHRAGRRPLLSEGLTWRLVRDAVDVSNEPGGRPVPEALVKSADAMVGPNSFEQGTLPFLYAGSRSSKNLKLVDQVRRAAAERLLAAWYYLEQRNSLLTRMGAGALSANDPNLDQYETLGTRLRDTLRNLSGSEYAALRGNVEATLDRISQFRKEHPND